MLFDAAAFDQLVFLRRAMPDFRFSRLSSPLYFAIYALRLYLPCALFCHYEITACRFMPCRRLFSFLSPLIIILPLFSLIRRFTDIFSPFSFFFHFLY